MQLELPEHRVPLALRVPPEQLVRRAPPVLLVLPALLAPPGRLVRRAPPVPLVLPALLVLRVPSEQLVHKALPVPLVLPALPVLRVPPGRLVHRAPPVLLAPLVPPVRSFLRNHYWRRWKRCTEAVSRSAWRRSSSAEEADS